MLHRTATPLVLLLTCLGLAACSREDRKPAVDLTIAAMGNAESDLDHAAVELVRLGLTLEAYQAEGMDDPAAHDEYENLQLHESRLRELLGTGPTTSPEQARASLEQSGKFDPSGEFTAGDRNALFDTLSQAELSADRAWMHYYH